MYRYGLHLLEMTMSVLQEVQRSTKNYTSLYFQQEDQFHAKFQAQCLHVLPVSTDCIIMYCQDSFSRSKRVKGYAYAEENLFACKISSVVLLRLLSYASS